MAIRIENPQLIPIIEEVFVNNQRLNGKVTAVVASYLKPEELSLVSTYEPTVNPLKQRITPDFFDNKLAKTIYEVNPRHCNGDSEGLVFPMHPEVLAYATKLSAGKTVLELAGASGENSILLARSATKVYMNEMDPVQIEEFKALKAASPEKDKLVEMPGSCFNLPTDLKVDLVLCRNLIHFFSNKQQTALFDLLKKILTPGGKVIFTVNSAHFSPASLSLLEDSPDATSFKSSRGYLTDRSKPRQIPASLFCKAEICPDDVDYYSFNNIYLYEKSILTGFKWIKFDSEAKKLDKTVKKLAIQALTIHKTKINSLEAGSIHIRNGYSRSYTTEQLTKLFQSHGFEVEVPFAVGVDGHLTTPEKSLQVGVIARL